MADTTILHVSGPAIRRNLRRDKDTPADPPFIILDRGGPKGGERKRHAFSVEIQGPARLVYSDTPLRDGARCWIETEAAVTLA